MDHYWPLWIIIDHDPSWRIIIDHDRSWFIMSIHDWSWSIMIDIFFFRGWCVWHESLYHRPQLKLSWQGRKSSQISSVTELMILHDASWCIMIEKYEKSMKIDFNWLNLYNKGSRNSILMVPEIKNKVKCKKITIFLILLKKSIKFNSDRFVLNEIGSGSSKITLPSPKTSQNQDFY